VAYFVEATSDAVTDLESSRGFLESYAEKAAVEAGRIYGIWADGKLVGGVLFRTMDVERGNAEGGLLAGAVGGGQGPDDKGRADDHRLGRRSPRHPPVWSGGSRRRRKGASLSPAGSEWRRTACCGRAIRTRGKRYDIEVWSVLAPEWRAAKRAF
jgi:ribosomal-protein-serine acetyltransferase